MEVAVMENEMVATGSAQVPMFRAGYRNLNALPQAPGLVTGCTRAPANYQLSWGMRCPGRSLP